jgi:hypothetical protein
MMAVMMMILMMATTTTTKWTHTQTSQYATHQLQKEFILEMFNIITTTTTKPPQNLN